MRQANQNKSTGNGHRRRRGVLVHESNVLSHIATNARLDQALEAVSRRRRKASAHDGIWALRRDWVRAREAMRTALLGGDYRFEPLMVCGHHDGHRLTYRSAQDAVVLKALALGLASRVAAAVGTVCVHLSGHGGLKGGVRQLHHALRGGGRPWVVKSDVADYYATMGHRELMSAWRSVVRDKRILELVNQVLDRVEVRDGLYSAVTRGIAKGCPLSPLMGALLLKFLDVQVPPSCVLIRYMDDWVILSRTRAQLRTVVRRMHQALADLGLRVAPSKTFIGRASAGFDFLGYRFNANGLVGCALQTIERFKVRCVQLYERGASQERLQAYVRRWWQWLVSGVVLRSSG